MKRFASKWTAMTLVLTMLVGLLPPITAFAAVQIFINNLYTTEYDDVPTSNDPSVQRFTSSRFTMAVTVDGISDDQINDLYYEITNMNTGVNTINKTNKPVKSTTSSNEITFVDVTLTDGMNRIVVKFGTDSVVSSKPGWAMFTPVVNITDLTIEGDDFFDNQMYPKAAPYNSISVSGTANNAELIEAVHNGKVFGPSVFNKGAFTFVTNTNRGGDLSFTPGDNELTLTAKNGTNTYVTNRAFIYDDGKAFAYQSEITDPMGTDADPSNDVVKKLVQTPTVTTSGNTVTITSNLKVSKTDSVTDYVYGEAYVASSSKVMYDFRPVVPTVSQPGATLTKLASADSKYDLYTLSATYTISTLSKYQEVTFTFSPRVGGTPISTKYGFYVVDPNVPYIDRVEQVLGGTSSIKISELGTTQISELPVTMYVYTTSIADAARIELNGITYDQQPAVPVDPLDADSLKVATFVLDGINDGPITMKVIPVTLDDPLTVPVEPETTYDQGTRTYKLSVSSVPYVILDNVYTGKIYKRSVDIVCEGYTTGPCLSGRFVNLPVDDLPDVQFFVNGKQISLTVDPATLTFVVTPGQMDATGEFSSTTEIGKKTFKFLMFINGRQVTEASYDVFILSDDVPVVNEFRPSEGAASAIQKFKKLTDGSYVTTEKEVSIVGAVITQAGSPTLKLTYRGPNKPQSTIGVSLGIQSDVTQGKSTTFAGAVSQMEEYGDYYFELTAISTKGVTVTNTLKITREALPYLIQQPSLIKNEVGKDQANVNRNFQKIIMQADGADSIVFGKEAAVKDGNTFTYEAKGLKPGDNEIKFVVNRGTSKTSGSIVLFYTNTPIEGAQYKDVLKTTMKLFGDDLELKFPKDTKLMRNDRSRDNQYLTDDRKILFGIADIDDGRVDKTDDGDGTSGGKFLSESTAISRYKPASKLFWIDAGAVPYLDSSASNLNYSNELKEVLQGDGTLPILSDETVLNDKYNVNSIFYSRKLEDQMIPTKRATLTLKYDPYIRDDAWKYVSVFQYGVFEEGNGSGFGNTGWKNLGGIVDPKKNTITVQIDSFGYFQVMYMNDSFEDITNHPWARNDLDTLYTRSFMLNKEPGRFLPNDAISRGEFVTMLVKIFDIPLKNEDTQTNNSNYDGTFADVRKGFSIPNSNGLYDYMHIEAGARAGIVRGSSQGLFLPNSAITRQDASVMIARAAELKMNSNDAKTLTDLQKQFTDANSIDVYARAAVAAVADAGFIEGIDNVLLQGQKNLTQRFDPVENMTRAQAATIAIRILKQQKKIPK